MRNQAGDSLVKSISLSIGLYERGDLSRISGKEFVRSFYRTALASESDGRTGCILSTTQSRFVIEIVSQGRFATPIQSDLIRAKGAST